MAYRIMRISMTPYQTISQSIIALRNNGDRGRMVKPRLLKEVRKWDKHHLKVRLKKVLKIGNMFIRTVKKVPEDFKRCS